ncbi:hypothetical protein RJ641_030213 [Dillenia turbinata]|uniref:Uncharacterized protein n=1 Tax=Dillenia turbinata TaxID=194707 RepID=A0AAN8ZK91_9MAGN
MRQREPLEFRTPQHPSLGTNNWGGASPLLARDIPKASLEQRYLRLNTVCNGDVIFPIYEDELVYFPPAFKQNCPPTPSHCIRGFISKLVTPQWKRAKEGANTKREICNVTLGSNPKKRRWFPRWDPKNRWPNGCKAVETMEKMISNRWNVQIVPKTYVLPPESRPGKFIFPSCDTIPVINLRRELGCDRTKLIQQIIKASQGFGFFQIFVIYSVLVFFFYSPKSLSRCLWNTRQVCTRMIRCKVVGSTQA